MHGERTQRRDREPDGAAALLAGVAFGLTTVASAVLLRAHEPAVPPASPAAPAARSHPVATVPAKPAPSIEAQAPAPAHVAGHARVWREQHTVVVAAKHASRAEVARQLAVLTGVDPSRPAELLHIARPLTLHWRGTDAGEAWRLVLGSQVNHAVQCSAQRCRLWLIEASTGGPRAAQENRAAAHGDRPEPHPVEHWLATPEHSDTAETAEAATDWSASQPDPPGLFPAD